MNIKNDLQLEKNIKNALNTYMDTYGAASTIHLIANAFFQRANSPNQPVNNNNRELEFTYNKIGNMFLDMKMQINKLF